MTFLTSQVDVSLSLNEDRKDIVLVFQIIGEKQQTESHLSYDL